MFNWKIFILVIIITIIIAIITYIKEENKWAVVLAILGIIASLLSGMIFTPSTIEPTSTSTSTPTPTPTSTSTTAPTSTPTSTPTPTTAPTSTPESEIDLAFDTSKSIPPEAENAAIRAKDKATQAESHANTARWHASEAFKRLPNYDLTDGTDYDDEFMIGGSSAYGMVCAGQRYNTSGISYVVSYENGQPEIEGVWYNDQGNESMGVPYYVVYWWESGRFTGQLKTVIPSLNVDPAGIFTFTDGSYYEGEFYIGSPYIFDGWGILYNSDGSISRAGRWQNGIFVDGTIFP